MVAGGCHSDGRRGGKLGLGFHFWEMEKDDDVTVFYWCRCVCKD